MRTQRVIADHLQANGWPFAESAGAGRQGSDILGTPDLAIEVKARAGFEPLAWLKQAETASDGRLPLVIFRCNGQGEDAARYPAMLRTGDLVRLLHAAGYGDPRQAVVDRDAIFATRAECAKARHQAAWEKDLRKQSDGVIADLEGDLAAAEAALTRVRDLHHIVETCGNPQHTNPSFTCPDCDAVCSCGGAWVCETAYAVDGDDA